MCQVYIDCQSDIYMKDQRYLAAFNYILQNEGCFSNFRADPGGATKYGISLRFLTSCFNNGTLWADVNSDGIINEQDVMLIDLEMAQKIYFLEFWKFPKKISNNLIAIKFFDMCVNMGQYQAICLLEKACGMTPTGRWNKSLEDNVNAQDPIEFSRKLVSCCVDFYQRLATKNPKLKVFLTGWIKRANRLP